MHPPILRCLVPGAMPAVGPLAEPGQVAPVPALIAIETLTAYLRSIDPARENRRTWEDFVVDHGICNRALLTRCAAALEAGRRASRTRSRLVHSPENRAASQTDGPPCAPWRLRLQLNS